jgi:hypothetical protein
VHRGSTERKRSLSHGREVVYCHTGSLQHMEQQQTQRTAPTAHLAGVKFLCLLTCFPARLNCCCLYT